MAYGRKVNLFVGNFEKGNISSDKNLLDLSALDIEFDVTRSIEWYDNEATIIIYNPSASTLNMLMSDGNSVILQAGYDDGNVGNLFIGQIAMVKPVREGSDIVVTLTCLSARGSFYQLARLNCSIDFKKGTPIKECLQMLCEYAQIALRSGFKEILAQPIKWNFNSCGTFFEVLQDFNEIIFRPMTKMKIYVDNNEMIIFSRDNIVENEEIILDFERGLLECHEVRDEKLNKVNFGDDPAYYLLSGSDMDCPEPKKKPSVEIERVKEIEFVSLMNASICPNCFVNINSSTGSDYDQFLAVQGRYIVTDCKYSGCNTGSDFTVTCKAQEAPFVNGDDFERSRVSFDRGAHR